MLVLLRPIFGGIFNIMEFIVSFGKVHKGLGIEFPTSQHTRGFIKNLFLPFISLRSIYSTMDLKGKHKKIYLALTAAYTACFFAWIALFVCGVINYGFIAFGWTAFFLNACILTSLRMDVRSSWHV